MSHRQAQGFHYSGEQEERLGTTGSPAEQSSQSDGSAHKQHTALELCCGFYWLRKAALSRHRLAVKSIHSNQIDCFGMIRNVYIMKLMNAEK